MNRFQTSTQVANRRRLLVFLGTFGLITLMGLAWCFTRPAIYLVTSRVQVNPGQVQVEAAVATGGTQGANASRSLFSEVQVLTSRVLVAQVLKGLDAGLQERANKLGPDPLAALQASMEAVVAPATDIIELNAKGPDPVLLASLLNDLVGVYKTKLEASYLATVGTSQGQSSDEVEQLTKKVAAKRAELDAFKMRYNIVSIERDENEVLGQVKGQTEALNKAQERVAVADAKLKAMADGASPTRPQGSTVRANTTLDNMEQRASSLREEAAELNRLYTPEYLAMDPRWRSLRGRQSELERQIAAQKQSVVAEGQNTQSAALADAREEAAAARGAADRLRSQVNAARGNLSQFSGRFNQYQQLSKDLAPLEGLLRDATQRKARLEANESARRPSVQVIEPAIVPKTAWKPDYSTDAGLVLLAAAMAGVLAVWLVEMFNREAVQPTMVVAQPMGGASYTSAPRYGSGATPIGHSAPPLQRLGGQGADASGHGLAEPVQLAGPAANLPRELLDEELQAILQNATVPVRRLVHLLLRGLRPEEALALRGLDIDTQAWVLRIAGAQARQVPVDETLLAWLAQTPIATGQSLLAQAGQPAPSLSDLTSGLLYAAHDASVDVPAEVTPGAIWHTAVGHLARQGARLGDIATYLGQLNPQQAAMYSALAPAGTRLGWGQVQRLLPAAQSPWT